MSDETDEFGWGCRKGEDVWHCVTTPFVPGVYWPAIGKSYCGLNLTRENDDVLDYNSHPRIGPIRCQRCESERMDHWVDWLNDE